MNILKGLYKSLFFSRLFYLAMAIFSFLFVLTYWFTVLFLLIKFTFALFLLIVCIDFLLLFTRNSAVSVERILPDRFNNGEQNSIYWKLSSRYNFNIYFTLIDEFPESWQIRDFKLRGKLKTDEPTRYSSSYKPSDRGEYLFGDIHIFIKSPLRLVVKRNTILAAVEARVYPTFFSFKNLEFEIQTTEQGHKANRHFRKIGQSQEFEQIREFVTGDDIRSINWKATGRTGGQLMTNVYTDEKSQQVYCVIDKGRSMRMAFNSLTLLDYSVNAALAMSNVALSKQDNAGIISFGDKQGDYLQAGRKSSQMNTILNTLYNLKTRFLESDFSFLHSLVKTRISQRSLLILFTNFETVNSMNRQLPYLRSISRKHLLLVVFFENTSLNDLATEEAANIEDLYEKTIAEKFILEKKLIVRELQQYGIPALLTKPQDLTVNTINKYLQIKARREI